MYIVFYVVRIRMSRCIFMPATFMLYFAQTLNMPSTTNQLIDKWKSKAPSGPLPAIVTHKNPTIPILLPTTDPKPPTGPPHISTETPPFSTQTELPSSSHNALLPLSSHTDLNSTFVKNTTDRVPLNQTPMHTSSESKLPDSSQSYKMTPADPIFANYDIHDISSDDSTDEEDQPKKPIPTWALPSQLNPVIRQQEEDIFERELDPCDIFPPNQLLKDVNLAQIFKHKRKRFYERSSSAHWNSPIL